MEILNPISSPLPSPPPSSPPPFLLPQGIGEESEFDILDEMTDVPLQEQPTLIPNTSDVNQLSQASPVDLHPQRIGTKCGHVLYPFQAPHTPLCDFCLLAGAQRKFTSAIEAIGQEEIGRKLLGRSLSWNKARLKFFRVKRAYERVAMNGSRRTERKKAWDEAHIRWSHNYYLGKERRRLTGAGVFSISSTVCFACESLVDSAIEPVQLDVDKETTWWEQPGAMAPDPVPQTPRPIRRRRPFIPLASSVFRDIIREERAIRREERADEETWQRRSRTESAFRRKHGLPEGSVAPEFWDRPLSGLHTRQQWQAELNQRRLWARQTRGGKLPPLPGSSPLRQSASIEEVGPDDVEAAMWEEEGKKIERIAFKIAEEVGYLYFVGLDAEDWKDDYLASDYRLVQRESTPSFDDEMIF
ncbi:hypothetical protein BDV96DRAFT_656888 [Lophiotrema nucula]|uniref:Uncharacterized protein n=1 Tax=Lophiotrema nucula TaxID=690887 RepID=A0A6A5ZW86_9PLEO|nr:hypothetical protein BDV96DRAFT_656888 [Lophiotrema nucula]